MKFEGGVHRVQRVPKTEKQGRMHTSTMTVAVLPQPTEVEACLWSLFLCQNTHILGEKQKYQTHYILLMKTDPFVVVLL